SFVQEVMEGGQRRLTELKPRLEDWQWTPAMITARYRLGFASGISGWTDGGINLVERRSIGADSRLHCEIELSRDPGSTDGSVHVVGWTMRERPRDNERLTLSDFWAADGSLSWRQSFASRAHGRGDEPLQLKLAMHTDREPDS